MRNRLFFVLTVVAGLALLELGSFLLLSLSSGVVTGYGALDERRRSRLDTDPVEMARREPTKEDWGEHRIARAPALHPFIGFVPDPITHPKTGAPGFSRQAADYGFPLNRTDLFRGVDDGEVVIGFFGGSFAANLSAGGTRLAEALLEYSDRFDGKKLTVLSFAIAGSKQPQQLMALNYLLSLGVHLDVVVNLDGFNEVALASVTNVPMGYFAFYPRGWPLMVGDLDQEERRSAGELTFLRERRARRAALFSRAPWRLSLTAGLVWTVLDAPMSGRITELELAMQSEDRSTSGEYQARGPTREYASDQAMYEDQVAVWKRSSLLMDALCRGRGIDYFHFIQPNQYLPGSKPLSAQERKRAWKEEPYKAVIEQAYPLLVEAGRELRREGVRLFDLTQVYADRTETFYRDACCHVNAQGNVVIAQEIGAAFDADLDGPTPP